ncbi:MAG: MATE family efflux transporter [Rhodobacteraceae bacterium]|nr:MAG: MATE family efflux transporter [Paracoccaceae bacterium]
MDKALTHKRIISIALPVVVSNATIPILGAVDTGVVGQLGLAVPIGAVGIGAIITTAIYWIFGFLRMGTTGLTAQAIGAKEHAEVAALFTRSLFIGLGAGVIIFALQIPILWAAFKISPASDPVENLAHTYLQIRLFSAPAAIAIYGVTGWLIAHERTKSVLVLQLWMNGLNIALDLLFVLKLGWGVSGVAFATVLAEWSGLLLGLWLTRGVFLSGEWRNWVHVFNRLKIIRMMSVNSDIMIRSVILQACFLSFLFLGSELGDVTLAANQVLLQFLYITAYGLDGFALAAEALVGQAMGAGNRQVFRRAARLTSLWGAVGAVLLALGFWLLGGAIIDLMTTSDPVRATAKTYLIWMIFAPIAGAASWMLDGIFIGATRGKDMRNMMIISGLIYALSVSVLLPLLGNHGLWASLLILLVVRGITLGFCYPRLERSLPD